MGARKQRRQSFLARNPLCCFCGGTSPATTIDHIPARAFFIGRAWPETYAFPACESCNSLSKNAEAICSAVVKIARIADSPYPEREIQEALATLKRGAPEFLTNVVTAEDARSYYLRETGKEPGTWAYRPDSAVVSVPEALLELTEGYFQKLSLALFYKSAGRPAPARSYLFVGLSTNKAIIDGGLPEALRKMFPNRVQLKRGPSIVEGQFDYTWGLNTEEQLFGCFVVFGDSVGAICVIREGPPKTEKLDWRTLSEVHEGWRLADTLMGRL